MTDTPEKPHSSASAVDASARASSPQEIPEVLRRGIETALNTFVPSNVHGDNVLGDLLRYVTMLLEANRSVNLVSRKDTEKLAGQLTQAGVLRPRNPRGCG